ncbi:DUF262 domain-containing protein [Polaribacter atrinae]|uniref:GmrSD restriction endonucleases N-terminal domain-containing protein n=1 Tax=Polaribacter atrinae TaxID=1333662 RepID=A0A176TC27_9FLAO|nr:DUF262 domain-containing protein [Polaribacter atrinae]OAD45437.1 hypothetical protein LPB303_06705 [Polaribacter atrinae]
MRIKVTNWKISTLIKRRDKINEQPEYQRGKVWTTEKEALLIDSLLRGIDVPKIYLRVVSNKLHDYEVADGQQRLTAIFNFHDGDFKLINKSIKGLQVGKIGDEIVGGKKFDELPSVLQDKILDSEITISIIEDCSEDEVRVLFGRLQEGITLNAAEKRNAIISSAGKHIESIVLNHNFFDKCKISKKRFKHQDYLAHVFCLMFYNNSDDLKGGLIERFYLDKSINVSLTDLRKVDKVLDLIYDIDHSGGKRIVNKFTFIDIFWFLFRNIGNKSFNVADFKLEFNKFEENRLKEKDNLKKLAGEKTQQSINLYSYIVNYDRSGSLSDSIDERAKVFDNMFLKYLN